MKNQRIFNGIILLGLCSFLLYLIYAISKPDVSLPNGNNKMIKEKEYPNRMKLLDFKSNYEEDYQNDKLCMIENKRVECVNGKCKTINLPNGKKQSYCDCEEGYTGKKCSKRNNENILTQNEEKISTNFMKNDDYPIRYDQNLTCNREKNDLKYLECKHGKCKTRNFTSQIDMTIVIQSYCDCEEGYSGKKCSKKEIKESTVPNITKKDEIREIDNFIFISGLILIIFILIAWILMNYLEKKQMRQVDRNRNMQYT